MNFKMSYLSIAKVVIFFCLIGFLKQNLIFAIEDGFNISLIFKNKK